MNNISTFVWSYFAIAGVAFAAFVAIVMVWTWQAFRVARSERTHTVVRPQVTMRRHARLALHH